MEQEKEIENLEILSDELKDFLIEIQKEGEQNGKS